MTVDLYDLLGVSRDATPDQIRTAWRDAIADLGPGDRMFRVHNQAAEVLLDPARRAEHDRELDAGAEDDQPDAPPVAPVDLEKPAATKAPATKARKPAATKAPAAAVAGTSAREKDEQKAREKDEQKPTAGERDEAPPMATPSATSRGRRAVPTWVLAAVAVVTIAVLVTTVLVWQRTEPAAAAIDEAEVSEALAAAEEAAGPVLSYDYRDLDQSIAEAQSYMTTDYAAEHGALLNDLRPDIEALQTVVEAQDAGSAVVRTGPGRVDVLVLVNQVTERAESEPILLPVWATLRMVDQDGDWRVDSLANEGAVTE